MWLIPSVVREKDLHEDHEEQSGDYAKEPAERAYQPKACDERPNEAGQCYANFQRHYLPGRLAPRQRTRTVPPLAKLAQRSLPTRRWWDPGWRGATRPMPEGVRLVVPIVCLPYVGLSRACE